MEHNVIKMALVVQVDKCVILVLVLVLPQVVLSVAFLMLMDIATGNDNTAIFQKVPLLGQTFLRERSVLVIV